MSDTIQYGMTVSITLSDDPNSPGVVIQPGSPPRVELGRADQTGFKKWTIISGRDQNGPVKYGDVVSLKSTAGYLSVDESGGVSVSSNRNMWTQYFIGDGAPGGSSPREIHFGDPVFFSSMSGAGCVARPADSISGALLLSSRWFFREVTQEEPTGRSIHFGETLMLTIPDDASGRTIIAGLRLGTQPAPRKWKIINAIQSDDTRAVKFNDQVLLKLADNSGYLSCGDGGTTPISIVPGQTPWTAWAVQCPPSTFYKTDEIKADQTNVLLGSMVGGLLTRKGDSLELNFASASDAVKWIFKPTSQIFLRYGNTISIDRPGDIRRSQSIVPGETGAVTLGALTRDERRWIIRNADQMDSAGRVRTGDTVMFVRDVPTAAPVYLSCNWNADAGNGYKNIAATASQSFNGERERWKISDPNSTAPHDVSIGDILTLENISLYWNPASYFLSAGQGTNAAVTARVGGPAGDAEQWLFRAANPPIDPQVTVKTFPNASENSAAALSLNADLSKMIAGGVAKGAGYLAGLAVPLVKDVAGTALEGLITIFWPPQGSIDIWSLIKGQVEELVNDKIQDDRINTFANKLDGIKDLLLRYRDIRTKGRRGDAIEDIIAILTSEAAQGIKLGDAQRVLPYQVMLGTFHISALHETFLHGPEYWENYQDAEMDRTDLKKKIAEYSQLIQATKQKAIDWRKGLVSKEKAFLENNSDRGNKRWQRWKIVDRYLQSRGFLIYWDYDVDAAFERYVNGIADIFSQQLDDFLAPSYLWRYMDPDCDEAPRKRTARTVTGPYGKLGRCESDRGIVGLHAFPGEVPGLIFFYQPQSAPLSEIALANGEVVQAIKPCYGDRGEWHGEPGDNRTLNLRDRRIVKVEGKASWSINTLTMRTDKANSIQAGELNEGDAFTAAPPADTNGYLAGVSGIAYTSLDTLYLHWRYDRWE